MTHIEFSGQKLALGPEGTVYWRAESMLVVSDLCLERPAMAAGRRLFLQPHDPRETLERLQRAIRASGASRILFLGDSFADADGPDALGLAERDLLEDMCGALQAIWVHGHNGGWVPPRARSCGVFSLSGLTFRHQPSPDGGAEICGYFQPCVRMSDNGGVMGERLMEDSRMGESRRCFIEDGRRMVMPSFGAFTDGMDASDPALAACFPQGFRMHVLSVDRVQSLTGGRLVA